MINVNTLDYIFSENGPIKDVNENYVPRPSQIEAAKLIEGILNDGTKNNLILEGPCGFGKTFSYLIPIMNKLIDNKDTTAVIVTDGISLQEQLFYKDIPSVIKIFELNNPHIHSSIKYALLKGKQNFVCANKMSSLIADGFTVETSVSNVEQFNKVKEWYFDTKTGDLSELDFIYANPNEVACVDKSDCLGSRCPHKEECFYALHKQKVFGANIIITNYHMLMCNIKTGHQLLPDYDILVFDEAHKVANIMRDFHELKVNINVIKNIRNIFSEICNKNEQFKNENKDTINFNELILDTEFAFNNIRSAYFNNSRNAKFNTIQLIQNNMDFHFDNVICKLNDLNTLVEDELEKYHSKLLMCDESDPICDVYTHTMSKLRELNDILSDVIYLLRNYNVINETNNVAWIEQKVDTNKTVSLKMKPVDISKSFKEWFLSGNTEHQHKNIFTSATLSVGGTFDYIESQLGIDKNSVTEFIGQSPFNLTDQQLWYLPDNAVAGNDSSFGLKLPEQILPIIKMCNGGTLLLFTSIYNMNNVYNKIAYELNTKFTVLKQGDQPRNKLIQNFAQDTNSVLFATKSFFTGVDVPGDALRCVIIDKLPFPNVNDPVQKKLQMEDNSFFKYSIPEMIIDLKQAVGRGVRHINDKCVISILDGRMSTAKTYKQRIFLSFPYKKTGTRDLNKISEFLQK